MKSPSPDQDVLQSAEEKAVIDKRILRKLDYTIIPWLCLLYLLAFLDRTNIGNANIDGLQKSLHLSTHKYNASLSIFFVSYSIFEPVTNIFLKWLKPSIFIPIIMIAWGICMTFMGFIDNWSGLMAARWFLGFAEAGLFPGISFYLSCWYKRSELGIRIAIFFSAAAISGSFGGLLAAAIRDMDGLGGRPAWAWLFILEGIMTVLFGVASFWKVHDFPEDAVFLSPDERAHVISRLQDDNQTSAVKEEFHMKYLWMALKDYKMWIAMAIVTGVDVPLYAFSIFLPTIINQLGYSSTKAQLLSVPPYIAAAIFTIFIGWTADRTRQRGLCNIFTSSLGILGFVMLLIPAGPHVKYAGTFLGALGIYPCGPNSITWISNNIEGAYKRGIVLGFVIGWGNLNGIISSNIYFKAPNYIVGHATVSTFLFVFLFCGSLLLRMLLARENKSRKRGTPDDWAVGLDAKTVRDMGDARPDFIYIL